jgi:hypothetical protein
VGGARDRQEIDDLFVRTGQHDRIIPFDESIRRVQELVAGGARIEKAR